ncbi:hypothetical protein [Bradyrhizobium pachyrhizi]|uniref:hypothetical protein n=1 Tax=Bradyrhizobium pachyrhizi TaxID=280333 RepID=UPI003D36B038
MKILKQQDITRFIAVKFSNHNCECCGQRDWQVAGEENIDAKGTAGHIDLIGFRHGGLIANDISKAITLGVCVVACLNCGNLKLLGRQIVANWVDQNPA